MSRRSRSKVALSQDTITDKTLNMMERAMERAMNLGGEEFGLIVSKEYNARTQEELNAISEVASATEKGAGARDRFITSLLEKKEIYSEEDQANIPPKFKERVDQILQTRQQAIDAPRAEAIIASPVITREISAEEKIQNETSRLSRMIKANCEKSGIRISEENIQDLSSLIASTSPGNTELHSIHFPVQYENGAKPETIPNRELESIDNKKYEQFDKLRKLCKKIESGLPAGESKLKFREVLDKATEEHGSENAVRCAYHLSDKNYAILNNSSREIPEFSDLSESALLLKDNPKFALQFENTLHDAGPSGIDYLAQNSRVLLNQEGATILETHIRANSHRKKHAFLINKSTELERDILAPLQPENPIVETIEARSSTPKEKRVRFADTTSSKDFQTVITRGSGMLDHREGAPPEFEKPDLSKRAGKSTLSVKPDGYYEGKQTQRKEDLVKSIEERIKAIKPESGTPPTKEKIKDTIRYIQSAVPLILALSQGKASETQNLSRQQTTKESELILKHINRIARDALEEAGIKVKTSLGEKLNDLFASKSKREKVKETIRITAPNLIAALQSQAKQQSLRGREGATRHLPNRLAQSGEEKSR